MADEEAAFLASMQSANEAAGNYGVNSGASDEPAESNSSDEYDPAQAVPTVHSPKNAQESTIPQTLSNATTQYEPSHTSSIVPMSSNIVSSAPYTEGGADPRSQSRSMSRASLSTTSDNLVAMTNDTVNQPPNADTAQRPGEAPNLDGEASLSLPPHSDAPNAADPTSTKLSPVQVNGQDENTSVVTQDGSIQTGPAPDLATEQAGLAIQENPVTMSAETLSVPSVPKAEPSTKQPYTMVNTSLPKARLPHDTIGILEDRIKEDPRGDLDAWLNLINEHRKRAKLEDARTVYERFFTVFPAAAEQWVAYAQMENEAQNRNALEKIFQKTLMQTPHLPLWSMYLDHIRRLNNLTTDTSGQARQTIHQAYDLALRQVGLDKESGKLWQDYVQFIKSGPGVIGGSNWQDQQKMDLLRKTYQKAICVPTQSINLLWKEYDGFEMGLNKTTGRKFLQDQSPAYMSARSSYTALQNLTRNLRRTTLPTLPPAIGFDGEVDYNEQLDIWQRWIQWEKDDPLVLKQDDVAAYRSRIIFVYNQALMALRFWPELWCDASEFCFLNEMESEGNTYLVHGIAANPESCLLAFKRADRVELTTANEEGEESAKRRGAAVREPYDKVLDALHDNFDKTKMREGQDLARVEVNFTLNAVHQTNGGRDDDDEDAPEEKDEGKEKEKAAQIESVKNMYAAQTRLLSKTISHVLIAVMRAMRRIQGKSSFRMAFGEARKRGRGRITSDFYAACALIEFHCYDPETGRKIFERGLRLFPEDESFALAYVKHLVAINDHTNARVVFETAVTRLAQKPETVPKTKLLYACFHDFESRYGELTQIVKLEKRMRDLFPADPALSLFSRRFNDQRFDPTAVRPIISPATQTRPKVIPSIETTSAGQDVVPPHNANSPKRPLPLDESENEAGRPRKLQRGESPLKGAAGRRLDQQKRNRPPIEPPQVMPLPLPPPPLPRDVMFLLSIIPKAETYHATKFSPEEIVRLIRETNIPTNIAQLSPLPAGRGPPSLQHLVPPVQHTAPVQQRPHMPPMLYGQYNGQMNGPSPYPYNR